MRNRVLSFSVLLTLLVSPSLARSQDQPPVATTGRVGVINIQEAIVGTAEGKKALSEIQKKYEPRRNDLQRQEQEISALQDQLQKQVNTLSDDEKLRLAADLGAAVGVNYRSVPDWAAAVRERTGPSPFQRDAQRKAEAAPPPAPAAPKAVSTDLREALANSLVELGMNYTADAVQHSDVAEQGGEVTFVTPKRYSLAMSQSDLTKALEAIGKKARIKVTIGEPASAPAATPAAASKKASNDEEAEKRALADPSVQRYQELFPDAQIRAIRNLKTD